MIRTTIRYVFIALCLATSASAADKIPAKFEDAWNLISTYGGSGDAIEEARRMASDLGSEHPTAGYRQVLEAHYIATWELEDEDRPTALHQRVLDLASEALASNPGLVQGYVVRARALLMSSNPQAAASEADRALQLDPKSPDAIIVRADISRRVGDFPAAANWYKQFIQVAPNDTRKSNGYAHLAKTYTLDSYAKPAERYALIAEARASYEAMVQLDPQAPWKLSNFAGFLNNEGEDFEAAERYAQRALKIREFRMARMQFALARYQKLSRSMTIMNDNAITAAVANIESATKISLSEALDSGPGGDSARKRLMLLLDRVSRSGSR